MPLPTERPQPLEWEVDRHKLWRKILADYKELASRAPEGFRPVVKVYVKSRANPLELGRTDITRSDASMGTSRNHEGCAARR
jgi:hypothetical protein